MRMSATVSVGSEGSRLTFTYTRKFSWILDIEVHSHHHRLGQQEKGEERGPRDERAHGYRYVFPGDETLPFGRLGSQGQEVP